MKTEKRGWLNTRTEYEGLPIYFRRPEVRVADFAALRPLYPRLLVIAHLFRHVKDNGLPEGDYNDSLAPLNHCLTSPFDDEVNGLIAVIETFAGKRTYYIYLAPFFDGEALVHEVQNRFPHEELSCKVHEDPTWKLFHGYAADFQFP